jgi:hypothetical protein
MNFQTNSSTKISVSAAKADFGGAEVKTQMPSYKTVETGGRGHADDDRLLVVNGNELAIRRNAEREEAHEVCWYK